MKKSLFLIATAAIFAACSSNETIEEVVVEETPIGFTSNDVGKSTRADIDMTWMKTTDATNGKFGVYGAKGATAIFTNEKVTYETKSEVTDWYHPTVRYWDKSATNYSFYAYAPYMDLSTASSGTTERVAYNGGKFTFSNLTLFKAISATAGDIDDICVATPKTSWAYSKCTDAASDASTGNLDGHVSLDFNHILSKLQFEYKIPASLPGVSSIIIKKVELLTPTATAVTWNQTENTGVAGTTSFTYAAPGTEYNLIQYDNSSNSTALTSTAAKLDGGKSYIVVPNSSGQKTYPIGIKITYDLKYTDGPTEEGCIATGSIKTTDSSSNAVDMSFNQDYLYTVTVTVSPATIEFDVNSVKNWQNDSKGGSVVAN